MILNIDALSLTELRYIAVKHSLDDAEMLDREELIEVLTDYYEENGNRLTNDSYLYSPSVQQRFMSSLVEHEIEGNLDTLPGVQQLPEIYSETKIHLLFKDPYWAHAYWNVCPNDLHKLEQNVENYSLYLKVLLHGSSDGSLEEDSFEIEVDKEDTSWNVNLPERGRTYSVSLNYRDNNGVGGLLCHSKSVKTPRCYWVDNIDELKNEEDIFNLLFSSLVTKGGVMVACPMLREIVERLAAYHGG